MAGRRVPKIALVALALIGAWLWLGREPAADGTGASTIELPSDTTEPDGRANGVNAATPAAEVLFNRPSAGAREALAPETTTTSDLARVVGTITRAGDGVPLAGLELVGCSRERVVARASTDARGAYSLELPPGSWFVGSVAAPHVPWCLPVELAPGEVRVLDRAIEEPFELCVVVHARSSLTAAPAAAEVGVDEQAGDTPTPDGQGLELLAGARVALIETDLEFAVGHELAQRLAPPSVTTDLDGRAMLRVGFGAECLLTIEARGYRTAEVKADFNVFLSRSPFSSDGCLHVALEPDGGRIAGRVLLPDGTPLAGAAVFVGIPAAARAALRTQMLEGGAWIQHHEALHPPLAWTDAEGRFEARAPAAEPLELCVLPERAELPHHFTRPLDARERWVDMTLPASRRYELRLVDATGNPLEGIAGVRDLGGRAHLPPEASSRHAVNWDGEFRVFPVVEGRFSLLHSGGKVSIGFSPRGTWRSGEVEVVLPPAASLPTDAEPITVVVP